MDQRDQMRAADSDREAVAERLRSALNEGRLDLHEYDERLQRAYAAKTYGDLKGLLADLPGTIPAAQAQVARIDDPAATSAHPLPGPRKKQAKIEKRSRGRAELARGDEDD